MKIVIVGGGAGGLELATALGKKLGRKNKAEVLLIDRNHTHIWKPLLHEVASGSLNADIDSVSYRAHAYQNHYQFKIGNLCGIDRQQKNILLEALSDEEGNEVLPCREESYDYLVLAIGSVANDFSIPGVKEHCLFLDSPGQAEIFHKRLVNSFIRLNRELAQVEDSPSDNSPSNKRQLNIAIVGGGATGVELSAELFKAREWFTTYGLHNLEKEHLSVSLIEAGPCLLPALSERISKAAQNELEKLGISVHTSTAISQAQANTLLTKNGEKIEADIIVWATGVKAPEFLCDFGFENNRANQIIVEPSLQVKGDAYIFALGDCAGCPVLGPKGEDRWIPPRAQSAHQMASHVAKNLIRIAKKPETKSDELKSFIYHDYGSLVSLSHYTAFGSLMGGLSKGSLSIEGKIARMAYVSLYRMHQLAIYGWYRTIWVALSDKINHFIRPRLKLH